MTPTAWHCVLLTLRWRNNSCCRSPFYRCDYYTDSLISSASSITVTDLRMSSKISRVKKNKHCPFPACREHCWVIRCLTTWFLYHETLNNTIPYWICTFGNIFTGVSFYEVGLPVNHSVIYEETLTILCQLFLYRQFTCVFLLDAQSLQALLLALNVKNCLLTFTGLSPSYYLSDFCLHCGVTAGVGRPYSNPFDMASVLCQDWFILAVVVLALLISIYFIRALAALELMLGRFPSTDLFNMAVRSSVTSLSCVALLKTLATMLFAKDCAGLWILACMKASAVCSLMTVNL